MLPSTVERVPGNVIGMVLSPGERSRHDAVLGREMCALSFNTMLSKRNRVVEAKGAWLTPTSAFHAMTIFPRCALLRLGRSWRGNAAGDRLFRPPLGLEDCAPVEGKENMDLDSGLDFCM